MQTFLPYPDFAESARVLDNKRLGKQRVEAYQILLTLDGARKGWANHPAVKMWAGYQTALFVYLQAVCSEWVYRGYKDTVLRKGTHYMAPEEFMTTRQGGFVTMPPWLGDKEFHAAHRANLLRKDYGHYAQFGWDEDLTLPYVWPK